MNIMQSCKLCPRNCSVDRVNNIDKKLGYCGESDKLRCARASLHMWEEPCISGKSGSGTIFFSGCQLRCVYCQNHDIAIGNSGKIISKERLIEIFFELKDKGANNINLVTPSHFAPVIASCLEKAKTKNLNLPIIYNTSSYEHVETIKRFDGLVDVYLPDLKYYDTNLSKKYSYAANYFDVASKAIEEMVRQQPKLIFDNCQDNDYDDKSLIQKGVIVRHLVLPSHTNDAKKIINYLYNTYKDNIFISIMNQFTPICDLTNYPKINRKLTQEEYDEVVDYAIEIGVCNAFIQEGETALESFIPDFDLLGI